MHIDLNADLGEGCGDDAAILRYVSSANIACGWHAGDARTMRDTARAALAHGVALGAHPSFPDRAHFGRRAMQRAPAQVYQDMLDQIGALDEIVRDRLNEALLDLWARTGKTIVFVTHSIPEAVYLSTKIVVMSPRPGRITKIIDSPLPRERPLEIRDTPEFIAVAQEVREGLREGHSYD